MLNFGRADPRSPRSDRPQRGGLLQGRLDHSLDEVGFAQAAELAKVVGRRRPGDLQPAAAGAGDGGGVRRSRRDRRALDRAGLWRARRPSGRIGRRGGLGALAGRPEFTPPGGESMQAMAQRVRAACPELTDEATEQRHRRGQPRVPDQGRRHLGARRRTPRPPGAPTSTRPRSPGSSAARRTAAPHLQRDRPPQSHPRTRPHHRLRPLVGSSWWVSVGSSPVLVIVRLSGVGDQGGRS